MAELSTLGSVIKTAYEAEADTNAYTDAEKSKLAAIEAAADVTDTANVTAAGALMDSEVTNLAAVKAFDPADYATAAQGVQSIVIACSDETTALTTGLKVTFRMPYAMTLTDIKASVTTAPTGSSLIADVHEGTSGGTSIMTTNKLEIEASEFTTEDATTQPALTDTALAADAEITVYIDQIGSTIAGAGLKVTLIGTRA